MKTISITLFAAFLVTSCGSTSEPQVLVKGASTDLKNALSRVEKTNRRLEEAYVKGDSAALMHIFHSEAKVFPPDQPEGNASHLGAAIKVIPESGITRFNITTTELKEAGEFLLETGDYSYGNEEEAFETGNYLVIWKQEKNEWKIYRDIWNSDMQLLTGTSY